MSFFKKRQFIFCIPAIAGIFPNICIDKQIYDTNTLTNISTIFNSPKIEKLLGINTKPSIDEVLGYLHKYLVTNNKYSQYGTVLNEISVVVGDVITITTNPHSTRYTGSFQLEYGTIWENITVAEIFSGFSIPNLYYVPSQTEVKKMLADYLTTQSRRAYVNLINFMKITIGGTAGNLRVTLDASNTPYSYISGQTSFNYLLKTPSEFYKCNGTTITGFSDEFKNNQTKYNMYSIMEIPNKINGVAMTSVGDYAFVSSASGGDGATIIPTYLNTLDMSNCLSITSIGDASFNKSSMIKSLTLPPRLQTIARWTFGFCETQEVVFPNTVTEIGASSFNWSTCKKITIKGGNTTQIKFNAFYNCYFLGEIVWENLSSDPHIDATPDGAFLNCGSKTGKTNTVQALNPTGGYTSEKLLTLISKYRLSGTWIAK